MLRASGGAVGDVANALQDREAAVRAAAVRTLASIDGSFTSAAADRLAVDPSPTVRAELSVALVRAGEEDRPHAILAALLESPDSDDRVAGLGAVARLGGHAPSPEVTTRLTDPSPDVRAAAVRAVAALNTGSAWLSALVASLDDEARSVRLAAAEALNGRLTEAGPMILNVLASGPERAMSPVGP